MYAWPIATSGPLARGRLLDTLQELQKFYPESLTDDDRQVIKQMIEINARYDLRRGESNSSWD